MADDHRYSWLDDKAVERLLRGESVEGQHGAPDNRNDRPHAEAERLAALLGAVAEAARRADGAAADGKTPLPGEDAAVAAFRAAHAKPTVTPVSGEGQVGHKSTRIARSAAKASAGAGAAGGWRTGWRRRRPLRAGMVAAVAGCALSGFAVAAAAGVLPFGHSDGNPRPGASTSDTGPGSGESARPEISESGGTSTSPDGDGRTSEGAQGRGVPGGGEGHGKRDNHGRGEKGSGAGNNGNGQRALGTCRHYLASEAGTGADVGQKALKKLTRAAGSQSGIHDYCVRVVGDGTAPRDGGDDTGSTGKTSGNGGTGSTSGTGGGSKGNRDDSGSGDDGGSSNPAPPPPSETPSGGDGSTPSPDPTTSGTAKELSDTPSGTSSGSSSNDPSGSPSAEHSDPAKTAEPNAS
ncbi:hypothetical protein [Streptomyces sp. NPDC021212]|uniref:hypothetical protein n=1 Tax=Streptomyces sp. NPDC021212 TaxID=3365118 RepID=UPI0037AB54EB